MMPIRMAESHHRCGKKGTPHPPHWFRAYFSGMGAVVQIKCKGEK